MLGLASEDTHNSSNLAQQRSDLEGNLASFRAETQAQANHNSQLQQQLSTENQAVRELQAAIEQEKATLEQLKQTALQAERELAEAKEKRSGLTQDLQVLKQEGKHFKQRADSAQQEIQSIQASSPAMSEPPPPPPSNDFFTLSTAPPTHELFAKVPEATSSPQRKTFDPFAGFKEQQSKSASSSPIVSLNALKEDAVAKQQARAGTPNVDISEVEAKFPDLTTMEHHFQSPASTGTRSPSIHAARVQSPAHTGPMPSTPQQKAFSSPKLPPATMSPSQKKSVAKYGFDLSAFEDDGASTPPATHPSKSVKDDLHSLFGSPKPQEPAKPSPQFDDIFGVPSQQQQEEKKPERKPTFDEMFF